MTKSHVILAALLALAACSAPTTKPTATSTTSPSVAADAVAQSDATRLVIYRTSIAGFAIQPKVFVDGRQTATCTPGRSMTVAVNPGTHVISATTLAEKSLSVQVAPGTTTYVRCSIAFGVIAGRAKFTQVPTSEGAAKSAKLRSSGTF